MESNSVKKTFIVAFLLSAICSVFVSTLAIGLKEKQTLNQDLDVKKNILIAAGVYKEGIDIEDAFKKVETIIIDLKTGEKSDISPSEFKPEKAIKTEEGRYTIPAELDLAGIKFRTKVKEIHILKDESGNIQKLIFPVYGKGLWSTLYGFIALESDLNTISGLTFYQHGETPGLGGEVDNPNWKSQWVGKQIFNNEGKPMVEVLKGTVAKGSENAKFQVDGLSGATITSRGVSNLLRYWFGDNGYLSYLNSLHKNKAGAANE